MGKNRLEAFSDGVIAIIITIMVLEMKVPHGKGIETLVPLIPVFLSYVLSFVYLGIYWNNHHHMLYACQQVTGPMLWANLHLLFWLSLIPFATGWMGENHFGCTISALWCCASDGRGRILDIETTDHCVAGSRFNSQKSYRRRLEGQAVAGAVRRGHSFGLLASMDLLGPVCIRCAAVAHTGSTDRERTQKRRHITLMRRAKVSR